MKNILGAAAVLFTGLSLSAQASTMGVLVDGDGTNRTGDECPVSLPGDDCVGFFIPLDGSTTTLTFEFDPVSTSDPSQLTLYFNDLDLAGVNDPSFFFEDVQVFNVDGNALTDVISSSDDVLVSFADSINQTISVALGVLESSNFLVNLTFNSDGAPRYARNTEEFIVTEVSAVPLPGAALLFGTVLAGAAARRTRRKA